MGRERQLYESPPKGYLHDLCAFVNYTLFHDFSERDHKFIMAYLALCFGSDENPCPRPLQFYANDWDQWKSFCQRVKLFIETFTTLGHPDITKTYLTPEMLPVLFPYPPTYTV